MREEIEEKRSKIIGRN